MHFGGAGVSSHLACLRQCGPRLLILLRYFAQKLLLVPHLMMAGMLHNNLSHLARHESSVLFGCPAVENMLVSVGCGNLQAISGGSSSISRLWNAFAHKLKPVNEEEIRALWGADGSNYETLDPRLDMP